MFSNESGTSGLIQRSPGVRGGPRRRAGRAGPGHGRPGGLSASPGPLRAAGPSSRTFPALAKRLGDGVGPAERPPPARGGQHAPWGPAAAGIARRGLGALVAPRKGWAERTGRPRSRVCAASPPPRAGAGTRAALAPRAEARRPRPGCGELGDAFVPLTKPRRLAGAGRCGVDGAPRAPLPASGLRGGTARAGGRLPRPDRAPGGPGCPRACWNPCRILAKLGRPGGTRPSAGARGPGDDGCAGRDRGTPAPCVTVAKVGACT